MPSAPPMHLLTLRGSVSDCTFHDRNCHLKCPRRWRWWRPWGRSAVAVSFNLNSPDLLHKQSSSIAQYSPTNST